MAPKRSPIASVMTSSLMLMAHPTACSRALVFGNGIGIILTSPIAQYPICWHCALFKPGTRHPMPECACEVLSVMEATELVNGVPPVPSYHVCWYAPIRASWLVLTSCFAVRSLQLKSIFHSPSPRKCPFAIATPLFAFFISSVPISNTPTRHASSFPSAVITTTSPFLTSSSASGKSPPFDVNPGTISVAPLSTNRMAPRSIPSVLNASGN
jgi:hypothetical protein